MGGAGDPPVRGRAAQVDSIRTRVESAYGVCNQCLKLEYQKLLSTFAFNFNLRRYIVADEAALAMADHMDAVGRCRVTVSKPVLKAPTVSALEATIR